MESDPPWRPIVISCDVSRITAPDERALDTLARLQLAAIRLGATIRLHNACPLLVDLIDLAGLADVLVAVDSGVDSGVEVDGEVEEREQIWIDEEILRGDPPA